MRHSRSFTNVAAVGVLVLTVAALAISVGAGAKVEARSGSLLHRGASATCSPCYYLETVDDKANVDNYVTGIDSFHFNIVGAYKSGGNYHSFVAAPPATPSGNTPPPYTNFSPLPNYNNESTFAQGKDNFSPPPGDSYIVAYALPSSSGMSVGAIFQSTSWTTVQPPTGLCAGVEVLGVNDTEQGVGWYEKSVSGGCKQQAFEFYPNATGSGFTYVDLGPTPSPGQSLVSSSANGINTLGDVVGTVTWATGAVQKTVAWVYSDMTYYQFSNGSDATFGHGINFNDGVVGDYIDSAGTHGFLVAKPQSPQFLTIDYLLNGSPVPYTILNSINTQWAVSGWYDKGDNVKHGLVGNCNPCPNSGGIFGRPRLKPIPGRK